MNVHDKKVELLSASQIFAALDYTTIEETSFSNDLTFEITRDGIAHGLRGWFECEIGDDAVTTNAPDHPETVYGAPFLPFDEPVAVKTGETIVARLATIFEKGEYTWNWQIEIFDGEKQTKARFKHSTAAGVFIAPGAALKQSEYFYSRKPNEDARIDSFILNKMDGENLQGDIADELLKEFSGKFEDFEKALERVSQISQRYSE